MILETHRWPENWKEGKTAIIFKPVINKKA
jgi:hypothetical protein